MSRDYRSRNEADGVGDVTRWIQDARGGSRQSLGRALDACRSYLRVIASTKLPKKLRSKESLSDLVQRTLQQGAKDFSRFKGNETKELKAWLHAILHMKARAVHRHFKTGTRQIDREVSLNGSGSGRRGRIQPAAKDPTPLEAILRQERTMGINEALGQLPPDDRRVIELRQKRLQDCSWTQIGEELGVTAGAARARWYRAIEKLRDILNGRHGG